MLHEEEKKKQLHVLILQQKCSLFKYLNERKNMIQKYATKYVICGRKVHRAVQKDCRSKLQY